MPISQPAIDDGAVAVVGKRIAAVGKWRELSRGFSGRMLDLGDVVVMPGLINAHCHLDYTAMAGQLAPTGLFTDWLKLITELKAGWAFSDYAQSWISGAQMLLRTGTTTVGDIEAVPELLPGMWHSTPLRVFSFLEMIGITGRRPPAMLIKAACKKIRSLRATSRHKAWLSPHAPYSTVSELLRLCADTAAKNDFRLCMHIGESELEYRMFMRATGPMHAWMKRSGRDMSDCGLGSPLAHAYRSGLVNERLIAVHMNYLRTGDERLLASSGTHVVHCPRSHAYFGHRKFHLRKLLSANVNVCLGTDSLASVLKKKNQTVELNMFEEIRALLKAQPGVTPGAALRMATMAGARALGMQGQAGELSRGAYADLIVVPIASKRNLESTIAAFSGNVSASMIEGRWAIRPEVSTRSISGSRIAAKPQG